MAAYSCQLRDCASLCWCHGAAVEYRLQVRGAQHARARGLGGCEAVLRCESMYYSSIQHDAMLTLLCSRRSRMSAPSVRRASRTRYRRSSTLPSTPRCVRGAFVKGCTHGVGSTLIYLAEAVLSHFCAGLVAKGTLLSSADDLNSAADCLLRVSVCVLLLILVVCDGSLIVFCSSQHRQVSSHHSRLQHSSETLRCSPASPSRVPNAPTFMFFVVFPSKLA